MQREPDYAARPEAKLEAVPDTSAPQNPVMDKWLGYSTGAIGGLLPDNVLGMVRYLKSSAKN